MTLEMLSKEMIIAMKNKDKLRKDTISALIGAVKKAGIDKGCRDNIPESLVTEVILKEQKTINEMIDTCPKDRIDLLKEYVNRAEIIKEFAPKMLTEEEIKEEFLNFCKEKNIELIKNNKAIIMKNFMPTIKGRADGKIANKIISENLVEKMGNQ